MPSATSRLKMAVALTELFAPVILVTVMLLSAGLQRVSPSAAIATVVAITFVAVIPFAAVYALSRMGKISDHHVSERHQRAPVLMGTAGSIGCGLVVLAYIGAPEHLLVMIFAVLAGLILVALTNLVWKLSAHAAVAAFFCIATMSLYGPWAIVTALIPGAVGWSRVVLHVHTARQVWVGYLLGSAIGAIYSVVSGTI